MNTLNIITIHSRSFFILVFGLLLMTMYVDFETSDIKNKHSQRYQCGLYLKFTNTLMTQQHLPSSSIA